MTDTLHLTFLTEQIGESSQWHLDEPHHLIVLYRGGQVQAKELVIQGGPSTRALPRAGDVLVIPADRHATALARGREIALGVVAVSTAVLADRSITPRIGYHDPFMYRLIERASTLTGRDDVPARLFTESLIESLRLHLSDHYALRPHHCTGRTLDNRTQARLVEYLEDSLDSEITLAQLAAIAEMPAADFSKAFAAAFGVTPYQFLLERRMHRAKSLLATTAMPITEIAIAVGFNTPSHFATTFKRRVGTTPSIYRKIH